MKRILILARLKDGGARRVSVQPHNLRYIGE